MNIFNLLRKPLRTSFDSTRILILLIFAALTLRVLFIWASLSYLPATSDEASLALLAKMISRGARPLLFIGQPYQFPIESYLMSPFIEWLPRNAIGVRYQCLLLGLLSTVGFIAILRQALPSGLRWPSILLVLFPSAYLLMLTSAYAPPQYSISITLAWMSIFSALRAREKSSIFWFFLASLLGLA